MSYEGYREYPQLHGPFEHGVSVLDLLLNVGDRRPASTCWERHEAQAVVIFGVGAFAQVAAVYLRKDSPREVIAYTVDGEYVTTNDVRRPAGGGLRGAAREPPT